MTMRKTMPVAGVGVVMRVLCGAVLVAVLVAGCAPSSGEPAPATVSATVSASPTPSVDAEAAQREQDEAAILDVYSRYWEANVAAQRGNPDPGLFDGVATGALVEERLAEARQFQEFGIVREGQPSFSQVTVDLDGAEATVWACVDYSSWVVPDSEGDAPGVVPGGVVLNEIEGSWLAVGHVSAPEDFACEG